MPSFLMSGRTARLQILSSCSLVLVVCLMLHLCHGSRVMKLTNNTTPDFTVKAVNLGGWLVTEGWIKPELFAGIPNKDLLDGNKVQFMSQKFSKFMCAENGGGDTVVVNRPSASAWETFRLWRMSERYFSFRVNNDKFVGLNNDGNTVAVADTAREWEVFEIIRNPNNLNLVRIKAYNGKFLQAKEDGLVAVEYLGQTQGWDASDPSIFEIKVVGTMAGEFQVTNGYGPQRAPQVMKEHWNTFVVESDFKFMSENGINAVRIPVGWWIAYGSNPPPPYVAGSLQALDNAFSWAEKYNIKVIVDLHAAPGSQNGWEHSSSRDGSLQWGQSDDNIRDTVAVIDFLANRYSRRPSLYAIELINEPLAPGVSKDRLVQYYKDGYNAVRRHSTTAYVVMSNRLGNADPKELLPMASGLSRTVIDVHYYNLFDDRFNGMTVQQNIDYIYYDRAAQLKEITTPDGPLIFVGEWVAEWTINGASKEDYQRFAAIQLEVYGRASFGWAYWTLKNQYDKWSLESMITNGYIKL